jgi:hypothetical protein
MKFKPVTFVTGRYTHNKQNTTQQILLLKALQVTEDPKKLRQMIGVKTVADVFRTLDKMALRKEYHEALTRLGINFDSVLGVISTEMTTAKKSSDRIKAAQIILKSLGVDKYEDASIGGGSWEDEILKAQENEAALPAAVNEKGLPIYDVEVPKMPESVKKQRENDTLTGKSLYE